MAEIPFEARSVTPERRSKLYWAISDSWVLIQRSIRHITRNLDQLLTVIIIPVSILLMFRYVFGGAINTGDTLYINFVMAGIFVQTVTMNSGATTVSVSSDVQLGLIDRFRSLPMLNAAVLMGHVVAGLARSVLSVCVLIVVGLLIGFRPNAGIVEWIGVFGIVLLCSLALLWIAAIFGLLASSVESASGITVAFIFVPYLSSAFVPTDTMPLILRVFAENQPVTHIVEALRALTIGTPMGNHGWLAVVWCVVITVVAFTLAVALFKRKTAH
jgi:ABC-2 type transport system permease protein